MTPLTVYVNNLTYLNDALSGDCFYDTLRRYQGIKLNDIAVYLDDQEEWRRVHVVRAKLKSSATTSHILCVFAMMAATELQVNSPEESTIPDWLWVLYLAITILLVSIHVFALTIVTYILPNVEAVTSLEDITLLKSSPHNHLINFVELAHFSSKVLGLLLFLVQHGILCWVKFWDFSFAAAIAGTIVLTIALTVCITFAIRFHHTLISVKVQATNKVIEDLEILHNQLRTSELFGADNSGFM